MELVGRSQRQAAAAEIEIAQRFELGTGAARLELEAALLEYIQPDQTQIADVLLNQIRNVIVAYEQHVERQVFAKAQQLVLAAR